MERHKIFRTSQNEWQTLQDIFDESAATFYKFTDEEWEKLHKNLQSYSYPNYETYAYQIEDKIVAYISYYKSTIEMLYVLPEYMNQGIGQSLIKHIIDNYPETLEIGVSADNPVTMHLYSKYGFVSYAFKEYDGSGVYCPHYLMRREYKKIER